MMWAPAVVFLLAASCEAAVPGFMANLWINFRSEMDGVLEMATVNYSTPLINTTYVSRLDFDMRAMGPLYNSTPYVIDTIANKQAFPPGIISVVEGHVELPPEGLKSRWKPLVAHYAGPIALVTVAALLAVALPVAGLFWCCCYWCRGGRRRRPFDRKYDTCLKGLLAIMLIALLTLFLFGVVCAFATETAVSSGGANAADAVRRGASDAREFLNATQAQARYLLVDNYRELEEKLNAILTSCGLTVSVQLAEFSRGVSVARLANIVGQLADVQAALRDVHSLTAGLRGRADQLNIALRSVKKQLLETLAKCEQPRCKQIQEKYNIGQLNTEIHYSQMPDVSELLHNVSQVLDTDIHKEVQEGTKVFRDLQRGVQRSVDDHIPKIKTALADTGRRLSHVASEISVSCHNASLRLAGAAQTADWLQALHARHDHQRHLAALGAAAALLAITLLLTWGLLCGVCGKRPDVYGASDCCNKGAGSSCLLCGTAIMFIVGGAISATIIPYFIAGVYGQRFICDPLTEPRGNRLFENVEQFVDLERAMFNERSEPDFNLTTVMVRCHANKTIYKVLSLHRLYDVSSVRGWVSAGVAAAAQQLPPARAPVTILRPRAKAKLRALADTGLKDFNFDRILDALETNMTSLALDSLASQLQQTAQGLSSRPGYGDVAARLEDAGQQLLHAHTDILVPMIDTTEQLNRTVRRVRDMLVFNHSSLSAALSYLLHETEQAEQVLNTQGPMLVRNLTLEFGSVVVSLVQQYLDKVTLAANHELGRCGPLSEAYNATTAAFCTNILLPINGYWMSLSWCLVLLVPLMVVSVRLARLYLHVDPYPGPLVEAEYLYDAYADRDNVPLANAYKAEKRVRAGAGAGVGAVVAGGAGRRPEPRREEPHARRYNDMAPKHWEEGPPRYGPTEYERPPPYYYPGANDRQ